MIQSYWVLIVSICLACHRYFTDFSTSQTFVEGHLALLLTIFLVKILQFLDEDPSNQSFICEVNVVQLLIFVGMHYPFQPTVYSKPYQRISVVHKFKCVNLALILAVSRRRARFNEVFPLEFEQRFLLLREEDLREQPSLPRLLQHVDDVKLSCQLLLTFLKIQVGLEFQRRGLDIPEAKTLE